MRVQNNYYLLLLLCRFDQAEEDCNKALGFELSPNDKAKALLRRGTARMHLYRGPQALQDFQAVLKLEPNNRQAKEEIKVCCGTNRAVRVGGLSRGLYGRLGGLPPLKVYWQRLRGRLPGKSGGLISGTCCLLIFSWSNGS